jgi:hypothetical protein
VGTYSPTAWDEPSVGSSFLSLFLGGILQMFFRPHKQWVPMLGLESQEANEHQQEWNKSDEHNDRTRSERHINSCQSMIALGRESVRVYL